MIPDEEHVAKVRRTLEEIKRLIRDSFGREAHFVAVLATDEGTAIVHPDHTAPIPLLQDALKLMTGEEAPTLVIKTGRKLNG
jgi:hypothetical protein